MTTVETLLTAEQFARLPDSAGPCELVRGRILPLNMPGHLHGRVCARLARLVENHAEEKACGHAVCNDAGVITQRDPDSVRGPDVAYYSAERLPRDVSLVGYPPVPPDLVFEVRSPDDRQGQIDAKVAEYLAVGVRMVVVVDPQARTATVHADTAPQSLTQADTLDLSAILPGFRPVVASFFP